MVKRVEKEAHANIQLNKLIFGATFKSMGTVFLMLYK